MGADFLKSPLSIVGNLCMLDQASLTACSSLTHGGSPSCSAEIAQCPWSVCLFGKHHGKIEQDVLTFYAVASWA